MKDSICSSNKAIKQLVLFFSIFLILANNHIVQAQTSNQNQIIASNSYNFLKYILWPKDNELKEITIALYKIKEKELTNEFLKLQEIALVRGKPIRIIETSNIDTALKSNVVYVDNDSSLLDINSSVTNQALLIISFESSLKSLLMINLYKDFNKSIKFEINNVNIINHNLQASPNLILLGGNERNISKLFLDNKTSFMNSHGSLENNLDELDLVNSIILSKEIELNKLDQTITQLQKELNQKQQLLDKQSTSLTELDQLIDAQRISLYFLIGLTFTTLALLLLGVFAYKMKRDDNKRLALRSQDLQVARNRLEKQKRKAEAANKAKGAFLSLMTHELRTPLQSIIGYTDLVIEGLKSEGDSIYSEQLLRVNSNGERLLELINNTLNLAKIEAGKMSVQLTPTHISGLIEEAVGNIKPLLLKNNNTIHIDIDDDSHVPIIDHDKLLQIAVNLLSNASKFTKNGKIDISIKNQKDFLCLSVIDTGIGLSKKQRSEIFKQFHQVSSEGNHTGQGTGLGLAITKYFCEIMGGKIRVESNDAINFGNDKEQKKKSQTGSTFIVEIPLPVIAVEKKFMSKNDYEQY